MGDTRYQRPYRAVQEARDRAQAIRALSDEEVIQALAAASQERDPLLANVLATEAANRVRRGRAITTHLAEGAFAVDREMRLTFVNPAMARMLAAARADLVGQPLAEVLRLSVEGAPVGADPLAEVVRTGRTLQFEGEIATLAGVPVQASFIVAPIVQDDLVEGAVVAFRDAREGRRAQEELARSERRYRTLYAAAPLMFITVDMRLRIVEANDAACDELGYARDEMVGADVLSLFPEQDRAQARAAYKRALREGGRMEQAIRKRTKAGALLDVLETMTRVPDAEGNAQVLTICRDVTRHARAYRELEESRERYRALFDNILAGIVSIGLDGVITEANDAGLAMTARTRDEVVGHMFTEFIHEEDHARVRDLFAQVLQGEARSARLRLVHKDGHSIPCEAMGVPIVVGGEVVGVHGVWREASGELRASEERYRVLVDSVKDYAIFLVDADGRVQTWNEGARRIKGYERDEIVGSHIERFYPPEAREVGLPRRLLEQAAREGRVENVGWRLRKDGSRFWADVVITALRDEKGRLIGYAKVTRDFTEHMQAEAALRSSEERHRALSRELEAFSYTVAHDLRAPIRAVLTLARYVEQDHAAQLAPEGIDLLRAIQRSAESMANLVDDLLAFGRSGSGELDRVRIDVSALAREIGAELAGREPGRAGELEVDDGIVVHGDAGLLRIVLTNLLGNALKFTRQRQRYEIRVRREPTTQPGVVVFAIEDNGAGFPAERADELFQPFRRLHAANEFPGTGVGLATVRRIAERHGGAVRAESRPEGGARFCITLPAGAP